LRRVTKSAGLTVLLITHRTAILELCDRIAVLADGTIARQGATGEMLHHLSGRSVSPAGIVKSLQ